MSIAAEAPGVWKHVAVSVSDARALTLVCLGPYYPLMHQNHCAYMLDVFMLPLAADLTPR